MKKNLVYSTETGRQCPECAQPIKSCRCTNAKNEGVDSTASDGTASDGIVRLQRQVKGRNGKTVTLVTGLEPDPELLKKLAKEFKARCGTGGSIEDNNILIQGDKRAVLKELLEEKGYQVKLSGG